MKTNNIAITVEYSTAFCPNRFNEAQHSIYIFPMDYIVL